MTRERLFDGKVFAVERRDGLEVVVHAAAAAVVAFDAADRLVLVRQVRVGAGRELLELPAGIAQDGEPPETVARRELREETGLHGGEWRRLATFFTTPGFCDELMHLYLATGLEEGPSSPDQGEDLEVVRVSRDRVPALVDEVEDAKTLAGLLLLLRL